jgi:fumarate reductase flavoprotein subunit
MKKTLSILTCLVLVMTFVFGGAGATFATAAEGSEDARETDVIIVGGGAAGLAAAVEAGQAGVEVVLFEKLGMVGGSTLLSGGALSGSGHQFQLEAGLTDDSPEIHLQDIMREGSFDNNLRLAKVFTDNAGAAIDWLAELGCEFQFDPTFPEHTVQRTVRSTPHIGTGLAIIQALEAAAIEAGVEIQTNSTVTSLVTDDDGAVIGVTVEQDGEEKTVLAKRVILASGGFAGNDEMLQEYAPHIMATEPFIAGDTRLKGDGILMGKEIGASLENMDKIKVYPTGSVTDGGQDVYVRYYTATLNGGILVNREGERFTDEINTTFHELYYKLMDQTDGRMFVIFDSDIAAMMVEEGKTPLVIGWSQDEVKAEFEENTLVRRGETVAELAGILNIDAAALEDAVAGSELNPDAEQYYGIEIGPNIMFTLGGLRVNEELEVLDVDGKAIPGLYAAGEVAGAVHGDNYMSGNYVAYAIVSGRIAGVNAAEDVLDAE